MDDGAVEKLWEELQKLYPDVVWEGKHIEALKELHGANPMEWQAKHAPKDLRKFLSGIQVDMEKD
ncbi:MAG: hypothetical protein OXE98_07370 [Hyphomicrobiales bacterium]|nr:hypothetical protein [Hyphomicrobiales bacterium]